MKRLFFGDIPGFKIVLRTTSSAIALGFTIAMSGPSYADQFVYWTNLTGQQLNVADITTHTNTVLENTPSGHGLPDSLIFDTSGNILYSEYGWDSTTSSIKTLGEVRSFNPTTLVDSRVGVAPSGQVTVDLALDPSGTNVLVSNQGGGQIDRFALPSGSLTVLSNGLPYSSYNGLTYDAKGNLFAVDSYNRKLYQINPITGAILRSYSIPGSAYLDGITFDPVTGNLFIANGGCLEVMTPSGADLGCKGGFATIDGVASNGSGDIIVADSESGVIGDYNIATGISTVLINTPGIDDIAPITGLGAPPTSVPEPSTLLLLASGMAGFVAIKRLRKT